MPRGLSGRLALSQQPVGLAQLADHLLGGVPASLHRVVLLAHDHGRIGLSQAPDRTPGIRPDEPRSSAGARSAPTALLHLREAAVTPPLSPSCISNAESPSGGAAAIRARQQRWWTPRAVRSSPSPVVRIDSSTSSA